MNFFELHRTITRKLLEKITEPNCAASQCVSNHCFYEIEQPKNRCISAETIFRGIKESFQKNSYIQNLEN